MNRSKQLEEGQGAIACLEEAVHLLRLGPGAALACYYLGSLPFVLGFLYFWADMSRSAFAEKRCATAALGLALLFLWMKTWQGLFTGLLSEHVRGQGEAWTVGRCMRITVVQGIIQPSGLFLLPAAFVITLPFGWAYAFYQNTTVLCSEGRTELRTIVKTALQQSQIWPGQNHTILALIFLFAVFVFLNLAIAVLELPQLVKMLFGIETVFSRSIWSMLNTTVLMAVAGLTYLCVDPVLKAVYVLRCFYGQAAHSGEDLRVALHRLCKTTALIAACFLLFCAAIRADAAPSSNARPATPGSAIDAPALDRAIEHVIHQREYAWRLPRLKSLPEARRSFFFVVMDSIRETVRDWSKKAVEFARRLVEWLLEKLWRRPLRPAASSSESSWARSLEILLYTLLAGAVVAVGIQLFRLWKRRRGRPQAVLAEAVASTPDLHAQNVAADLLPEEGWVQLARDLMQRGELRLALRAYYLAGLAHLGSRELVRIAQFKSNREYERELRRRSPMEGALQAAFSETVGIFERVWYGRDEVNDELLGQLRAHLERITAS